MGTDGVGNHTMLYCIYAANCLLDYELAHPGDVVMNDTCLECGCVEVSSLAGEPPTKLDWVCCKRCQGWVHFQCDKRKTARGFRDYAFGGVDYVCSKCA